jgi:hypothetical protein
MTEQPTTAPRRWLLPVIALIVGVLLGGVAVRAMQSRPEPSPESVALEKQGDGLWAGLVDCNEESITFDVRNENDWPVVVAARSIVWGVPTTYQANWRFDASPGLQRVTLNLDDAQGERAIAPDDYLRCSGIGIGYP